MHFVSFYQYGYKEFPKTSSFLILSWDVGLKYRQDEYLLKFTTHNQNLFQVHAINQL